MILKEHEFYHIYNRGINRTDLFLIKEDYLHFLDLYNRYINPVAETFAFCLMKNHLHLLVKIRGNICYKYTALPADIDPKKLADLKWETTSINVLNVPTTIKAAESKDLSPGSEKQTAIKTPNPSRHFAHLFNAYAKYFNNRHKRHGSLFEKNFKRRNIHSLTYLKRNILYIHNNPVHHGFCKNPLEYPRSSYLSCISLKPTKLQRSHVIGWFNNKSEFVTQHNQYLDLKDFEEFESIE